MADDATLGPELLKENRIFLYEDPQQVETPPEHVGYLRAALLDFDCTITDQYSLKNDDALNNLDWESAFRIHRAKKSEVDAVRASLTKYRRTKHQAKVTADMGDRDSEWKKYYYDYFFQVLENDISIAEGDSRRVARYKTYYDSFEWLSDKAWSLFEKETELRKEKKGLPVPKPDCVAYMPIYELEEKGKTLRVDRWQWPSNPRDGMAMNFSRKTLEHLNRHGLQASTAGVFGRGWGTELSRADYQCFPWLIVDHKEDVIRDKEMRCYCRVANAASASLSMYQTLAKYAHDKNDDIHIPPVVTMTTVGKDVRIWIAFACNSGEDHKMVCIWKGDVTMAMDIIKLEAILDNLHTYAMRELRPLISSYIGHWIYNFPIVAGRLPPPPPPAPAPVEPPAPETPATPAASEAGGGTAPPTPAATPATPAEDEKNLVRVDTASSETSRASKKSTASDATEKPSASHASLRELIQEEHDYILWKLQKLVKDLAESSKAPEKAKPEKAKPEKRPEKSRPDKPKKTSTAMVPVQVEVTVSFSVSLSVSISEIQIEIHLEIHHFPVHIEVEVEVTVNAAVQVTVLVARLVEGVKAQRLAVQVALDLALNLALHLAVQVVLAVQIAGIENDGAVRFTIHHHKVLSLFVQRRRRGRRKEEESRP